MSTDLDLMTADDFYQRLAALAVEKERLEARLWLLEAEREEARIQLRRLNAIPMLAT